MKLSLKQKEALKQVERWYKAKDKPVFRLFGYAGTGKTTLAKYFAESLNVNVMFAAYTGKAAKVLRDKGATNASTIHSLIYRPITEIGEKEPSFVLNRESEINLSDLVVIDECSMVDEKLGKDLLSFGIPLLVLGDPGQLPPIGQGGYFTNHKPDIQLEEIFRQEKGNNILHFSKLAREGCEIPYGDFGDVRVISKYELNSDIVLQAEQILVGRHKTRRLYNARMRELFGFTGPFPVAGDKLIAQRNDIRKGLLNGSCWRTIEGSKSTTKNYVRLLLSSEDEPNTVVRVKLLKQQFEFPEQEIDWRVKKNYDEFEYGYAITVHKSQGSQWDNVVLFDDSYAFREDRTKWLYTGITRAVKQLTIVR